MHDVLVFVSGFIFGVVTVIAVSAVIVGEASERRTERPNKRKGGQE